ncbi:MAG: ParA family protein [Ignavibacteriaceae bacterium]|nr:ParA family protein [Ignavibacteria bacterium]NNL21330.1 ParA family protein [Ignavibacteriaceae bacterium]
MQKRIAIALPKGGVGKTTTALNLAASLAISEKKTLLIDFDPSGTCTACMGYRSYELKGDIFQVFSFTKSIENVIHNTELPNLDFIPCQISSSEIEERVARITRNIYLFENILNLEPLMKYDYIIIDCPPYLSGLTTIALSAVNSVILPVKAGHFSIMALLKMNSHIKWVKENINRNLEIEGILLTMYESKTKAWELTRKAINRYFENHVMKTIIPKNISLTEAEFYRKPSVIIDGSARGSVAYKKLASEIIEKNSEKKEYSKIVPS